MTRARVRARLHDDRGMALLIVLLSSVLLCALGGALALEGQSESAIAGNYRDGVAALYAAEAAAGVVMARLPSSAAWSPSTGSVLPTPVDQLLGVSRLRSSIAVTASLIDAGVPDRIIVVAQANGPGNAQRSVRITVGRAADPADHVSLRILAWEEIR